MTNQSNSQIKRLSDYTDEELLTLWEESELSQRKFARAINVDFDAMHGKLYRAQARRKKNVGVSDQTEGNYRTLRAKQPRIITVSDMLKACDVDLNEWVLQKARLNKWEIGAKAEEKSIEWLDGQIIKGYVESTGKLTIEPLHQVELHLIRKNPVALEPVVSPVQIHSSGYTAPARKRVKTGKHLVLADPHFGFLRDMRTGTLIPFHDRRALDIALQMAASNDWDTIVIAGDILDLAEWSDKFVRTPEMFFTTQPAIIEAAWFVSQLRSLAPDAEIAVIEGNHDMRLLRLLLTHMNQAYGLRPADRIEDFPAMSVPGLLGLQGLGVEWVGDYPNGERWIGDEVAAIHGHKARNKSGATATAVVEDNDFSTVFGHVHRIELATRTIWSRSGPRQVFAFTPGCLCRTDGVVPGVTAKANWQQGIGIVQYNTDGTASPIPVFINDGRAVYQEQAYKGRDYVTRLRKDTKWSF